MAKYNWVALEKEYYAGEYESVTDFFIANEIPDNSYNRKQCKGWKKNKCKNEGIIMQKAIEKANNTKAREIAKELATFDDLSKIAIEKAKTLSKDIKDISNLKTFTSALKDIKEIKPEDELEENKPIIYIPAKDIGKAFVDLNRWINDRRYRDIWMEGGRGSTKSSFWSEKVVELAENNPDMCVICIRKVGNTLKDSVYSQIEWAIEQLNESYPGLKDRWHCTKSPLEIKNKLTGQIIYFRGADDPGKIKSIKPPKDKYIGLVVYEEFDQMNGMAEVRKIDQSVKRGGDDILVFRIYNTPKSNNHFVNKEKIIPKNDRIVHTSTYLDVPIEFLGQPFIDDAEYIKEVNYKVWENEYLGLAIGDGGSVFENLEIRTITDNEIENFDYTYQGMDFGWYPDPLAWTKMCYQPGNKTLYIFDEYVVNKTSNEKVWKYLTEEKGVKNDDLIMADSAEPKSIGDFQSYGSLMRGVQKGPDSVEYSMKWLSGLAKIVIDPRRCPKCTEEFTQYELEKDKDDNYISSYPDKNNHCIDSVRYAMNTIWRRKGE